MIAKKIILLFTFFGFCIALGCAEPKLKGLVPASGTVTFNGEPLDEAAVCFTPKEFKTGDRLGTGKTDVQGRFELRTIGELGILPGEYVVVVIKNEIIPGRQASPPGRPAPTEVKPLIPKRYGSPKTSDLNVVVDKSGIRDMQLTLLP